MEKRPSMTVERFDIYTGQSETIGKLKDFNCRWSSLKAVMLADGQSIIVAGARNKKNHNTIQLWSTMTRTTLHSAQVPLAPRDQSQSNVYGLVVHQEYVIAITESYTAVCPIRHLYGHEGSVSLCDNYTSPNEECGVVLDGDDLLLIGGVAKEGTAGHMVYMAPVMDIIHNRGDGWKPRDTKWKVDNCRLIGGAVQAYLPKW